MKGVYVFCGEEPFLIDKEVENIIKKHSNGQVIKYDLSEINVNVLLEDAFSISLFNDHKIIIGYNADFFSSSSTKEKINHDVDNLLKHLDKLNGDVIVIFITYNNLDKRKAIVKKILNQAVVKEFTKFSEDEAVKFAKEIFNKNDFQITFNALNKLIDKTGNNLYLLNSECDKLMLYKNDEKQIDDDDIDKMIEKYDVDNLFSLTDAVIKKDVNKALSLYQELLKRNEEPIKIIVMLANQFRLIFQVKRFRAKGLSESQIASQLAVHPYRVKLAKESNLDEKELLKHIISLADLDEKIKMGKIDKTVGLELFLLKL
ncbi:MAG TPA: DNA polymerase III subunit delta [Mollicutes bacterium]|nr:DNA polymerase III subunit delta [Mollicutes bacterium]